MSHAFDVKSIESPAFLKELSVSDMEKLAEEIRVFLIEKISKTGGHLSPNLGIVELTIALHHVFESPKDKLLFDVGHQAYVHKILTGRARHFDRLRKKDGLSGYIKREESVHDIWEAGHSSTALAAVAGFEYARVMHQDNHKNIAIVGDGSLNSGLSFEALNFIGHKKGIAPIIILNDNEMSISKNVGTLAKMLNFLRSSRTYQKASRKGRHLPRIFNDLKIRLGRMLRGFAKNMTIFDEFGLEYFGPIDGHDIKTIVKYLKMIKDLNRPCVLHVVTKKGKGYEPAENDKKGFWHGVAPFNPETGIVTSNKRPDEISWSRVISNYLKIRARKDESLRVVVPAMINGSKLNGFMEEHPDKIIDVGICESFAVCFSGALEMNDVQTFIPIYSTFLQRAYDQVSHDIARQDIHVVFGVDRAGIVGDDGETHQGIYDIAYLRHIPNMEIVQPKDAKDAHALLDYAFDKTDHPIAIRYSRNATVDYPYNPDEVETIVTPTWKTITNGSDGILIAYGENVGRMERYINKHDLSISLINARFIKPMDEAMLDELASKNKTIHVLEDVVVAGGLGSAMMEYYQDKFNPFPDIKIHGLPDQFIEQGSRDEWYHIYGLDEASVVEAMMN